MLDFCQNLTNHCQILLIYHKQGVGKGRNGDSYHIKSGGTGFFCLPINYNPIRLS
jgi:hypothetical protein